MKKGYSLPCNIAQTLNLIGDRWTLLILHRLMTGHCTYKQLKDCLDGIPSNLLSGRLKSLEADGLIESELYQEHPPRYRYTLSESGSELNDVFNSLVLWGEKHLTTCYKRLTHKGCKSGLEHRYYCKHCGKIITSAEIAVCDKQE